MQPLIWASCRVSPQFSQKSAGADGDGDDNCDAAGNVGFGEDGGAGGNG